MIVDFTSAPGPSLLSTVQWQTLGMTLQLTRRESQVCQMLFMGKTRDEIAEELGLKSRTIRQYCEQLHDKLNVTNRVDLVLRVIQLRDIAH